MLERAFYDTAIFLLSLNTADKDNKACRALLDIEGGGITWCIIISEISRGEATIREYLDQLEQRCALQGVEWIEVMLEDITGEVRKKPSLKRQLEQAGMQSRDIKQIFAAAWARSSILVTRDRDFIDPRNKRLRGRQKPGTAVFDVVLHHLAIEALFPVPALARLLRGSKGASGG